LVVAAAGEGEAFFFAPDFGGVIDECTALIARKFCFRWNSKTGRGTEFLLPLRDGNVPVGALLRREYRHNQPEATTVAVKVGRYRPEGACPQ
jgi:hypothetical protein